MKNFLKLFGVLSIALVLVVGFGLGQVKKPDQMTIQKKPAEPPEPNPDPGQKIYGATPNLAFPMIATDIIEIFYQKVWVDDDLDGEVDASEWVVGYDSTGDSAIDNVLGIGAPVPITVVESITDAYTGDYPGNTGFYYQTYVVTVDGVTEDLLTQYWDGETWMSLDGPDGKADLTDPIDMATWFQSMEPWFDQPVSMVGETVTEVVTAFNDSTITATISVAENPNNIWNIAYLDGTDAGGENSWQAEWAYINDPNIPPAATIYIDFIDWGNPLENTVAPIVGQRFPVEMAIYEKVASTVTGDVWGATMTAYKMGCIELPSTRDEVFGTSTLDSEAFTKPICFATVLTNKFRAEVWDPAGGITQISIEPGIGPSGKINFASAGGGWIPSMPGWHRIWMHFNDPQISLSGAIVNNDEHYIMSSGYMAEGLNKNKEALVGIVGDSTYVDVYVYPPSGGRRR